VIAPERHFVSAEDLFELWDDSGADAVEERLAAIQEMIRSWDWRANTFDEYGAVRPRLPSCRVRSASETPVARPPAQTGQLDAEPPSPPSNGFAPVTGPQSNGSAGPLEEPATTPPPQPASRAHSPQFRAPPPEVLNPDPLPSAPSPPSEPPAPNVHVTPPAMFEQTSTVAEPNGTGVLSPATAAATAPPVDTAERPPLHAAADDRPVPRSQRVGAPPKSWFRRWGKLILWVMATVAVVLFIAVVRHHNPGQTPGSLTPTSVKSEPAHTAVPSLSQTVPPAFIVATRNFDAANAFVKRALGGGSSLPVAQAQPVVSFYIGELEKYDFTLHITAWPRSLQGTSENLMLGNQALVSFLQSFPSVTPATQSSWFTQLHSLGAQAEAADNFFRKDIGLAPSTYYP
jgi:hypothetical protein